MFETDEWKQWRQQNQLKLNKYVWLFLSACSRDNKVLTEPRKTQQQFEWMPRSLCQEAEETPWHLLTECHATLDLRLKELPPEPWDVTSILKVINKLSFLEVVNYDEAPQQFE